MLKVEGYKMEFFSLLSTWVGYIWLVYCESIKRVYNGFAYPQGMGIHTHTQVFWKIAFKVKGMYEFSKEGIY
jgi:hypothetical protein